MQRRQFLRTSVAVGGLIAAWRGEIALAQAYPTRPLRILVGFVAGGNFDIVARLMGQCALAVTAAARSEALPEVPTVAEFVPGYEASGWNGVCAPRNTSAEIIGKLSSAINAGLADAKLKARLADLGATPLPGSSADFGKLIVEETEKWAKVIRAGNIKPS